VAEDKFDKLLIDDLTIIGIVKVKGKFFIIVTDSSGFPYNIKVGHKLADGFVLSIKYNHAVFRKTKENNIPLPKPKDIVKKIGPD